MRKNVSVVVPARNDAPSLREAVVRCLEQSDVEVVDLVIAVGPSSDGTAEVAESLAEEFDQVFTVKNASGLTPAALNLAIARTSAAIVARVDARSMLPDDYLANAVETLEKTGAGNVGAIQAPIGNGPLQRGIAAAMRSRFGSGGAAYRGTDSRRRVKTAYLGVFQRDALEGVGGYDEAFMRNQDAELNVRLRQSGYEVWLDPRLVVEYYPRSTLRTLSTQYWQYGWWRQRTIRKHRTSMQLRQLPAPCLVLILLGSIVAGVTITPLAIAIPMAYGLAMLFAGLATAGPPMQRLFAAAALVTMHLSWGAGFLISMVASTLRLHKEMTDVTR